MEEEAEKDAEEGMEDEDVDEGMEEEDVDEGMKEEGENGKRRLFYLCMYI